MAEMTHSGADYDAATAKVLADAMDKTIARSSDQVKAACGMSATSGGNLLSVLKEMQCRASLYRTTVTGEDYKPDEIRFLNKQEVSAITAVSAMLTREAELVAERDALKDERDQLRSDYLTAINAANVLAADNKALREVRNVADKLPMCSYCDPDDWNDLSEALARTSAAAGDLGNG